MEKTLKLVLCCLMVMIVHAAAVAQSSVELLGSSLREVLDNPRYVAAEDLTARQGFRLDADASVPRETPDGFAVLVPVVNAAGETVGMLSVHQEVWRLSMQTDVEIQAFELVMDGDVVVPIKRDAKNATSRRGGLYSMLHMDADFGGLTEVWMTGDNWCMYTSKIGVNIGCWSPDSNPFGYYYVTTYRKGDMINWNHYTWRSDYKGRGIACPLNEQTVLNMPQCGFPPD